MNLFKGNKKDNTNWGQSVTGVVIKENKVLLARHTYGGGKGKLIIPGGYVNNGETPQDALIREYIEETKITVKPLNIIGIRFNMHDWYIAFKAEYISGEATSDGEENSEVLWVDIEEALQREDVPELSKSLIKSAISDNDGLKFTEYQGDPKYAPYSLYCLQKENKMNECMKIIEKDDWKFSVDIEKTKEYYKTHSICECEDCRNFYVQVEEKMPKLKEFLGEFGVDILRPDDIFSEEFKKSIGYWYVDYTVCGKILISGRSDIAFKDSSKYKVAIFDGVVSNNEQTEECFTISFRPFEFPRVLDESLNLSLKDRIFKNKGRSR